MELINKDKLYQTEKFNYFWKFLKQPINATIDEILKKETMFKDVTLPHDWLIYNTKDLYETSSGWYKKEFNMELEEEALYFIRFEGIYMDASIHVNTQLIGEWKNGYSTCEFDMTKYLKNGKNTIIVQVRHHHPNSRWYSGAGIYRDVWLIKKQHNHIISDGIYVHMTSNKNEWTVDIDTELALNTKAYLKQSLYYQNELISEIQSDAKDGINTQYLKISSPKLWSVDKPELYRLETSLYINDLCYDKQKQNIGFKNLVMNPNEGLVLNGRHLKLNGVCEHHDLGSLGAAFNKTVMRKRMELLKKMGVNAIRTAHSVPAPGLMDLADELGFLIISEAFDMWERPKTTYDYARFFNDWVKRDVASWIRRDRNHVSLLMWSIGNEIYDTHVNSRGLEITKSLFNLVKKHDPKENAPVTIASNFMPWENAQKCADILKYAGYNYAEKFYQEYHNKYPDWVIYGSETASIVQSRGIYHFPLRASILAEDDKQCSSLGNSVTSWGAKSYESLLTHDRDMKFSLGQFIWTGFDYLGEPTPYDTKNAYFGQIDTAGFPKDSFYVYQAAWTDYRNNPMIHIFPYWQFNKSQMIDVRVCTNAPKMRLYLNDKLIGEKAVNMKTDKKIIPTWQIPFEKGVLKAIAYNEEGLEIAECRRISYLEPKTLKANIDKRNIKADGEDITQIEIYTIDECGNIVEDCNLPVKVEIEGPGKLLGLDNGDSTDYGQYKGNIRRMFSGKLKVLIGSTLEAGMIKITISTKELPGIIVEITSEEVELFGEQLIAKKLGHHIRSGEIEEILGDAYYESIPVARIELIMENSRILNKNNNDILIKTKIHPHNARYDKLIWRVVNEAGVASNIAKITETESGCILSACGDGNFILRCMVHNGKEHPDIISQLEFEAEGFGVAYKDPYSFVSAGLYDDSIGEIGTGNERGISTDNINSSTIIFHNVKFDNFGSDIITLPIFAFESKPLNILVYKGIPKEDSCELVGNLQYDKKTIWNVYQEETYKLTKRLKGIVTISFVFNTRVHFKGFIFKKLDKAYEKLSILDCDTYYGDSFKKESWGMANIGNNVTFTFEEMNFYEEVDKIEICGRSITEKNTIRIQATFDDDSILSQIVEFTRTADFAVKVFSIKAIKGCSKIEFIFLPGSQFDFKWFRFLKK